MLRKHRIRRLARASFFSALLLSLAATAAADGPIVVSNGSTTIAFDAGASPSPADRFKPTALALTTHVSTADEGRPPTLRTLLVDVGPDLRFDFKRVPVCKAARRPDLRLEIRGCSRALVGTGAINLEPDLGARQPVCCDGKLFVYNGGLVGGNRRLWLRSNVSFPKPGILVNALDVESRAGGPFSTRLAFSFAKTTADRSLASFQMRLEKGAYGTCATGKQRFRLLGVFADGTRLGGRLSSAAPPPDLRR
jgi:hypothetical protein